MACDLNSTLPEGREEYIKVGRRYTSRDTLDQSSQTLGALEKYGTELEAAGFVSEDTQRLSDARELLAQADVGQTGVRGNKCVASATYVNAFANVRMMRKTARAVLHGIQLALKHTGAKKAASRIGTVVTQTARSSSSAKQLDLLAKVLGDPNVMEAATKRHGSATMERLRQVASALRIEDRATAVRPGTAAETQLMDLLDGIIAELAQHARQASLAAAEQLGDPAPAAAFKLNKLYRARRRSIARADAPAKRNPRTESTTSEPQPVLVHGPRPPMLTNKVAWFVGTKTRDG